MKPRRPSDWVEAVVGCLVLASIFAAWIAGSVLIGVILILAYKLIVGP